MAPDDLLEGGSVAAFCGGGEPRVLATLLVGVLDTCERRMFPERVAQGAGRGSAWAATAGVTTDSPFAV